MSVALNLNRRNGMNEETGIEPQRARRAQRKGREQSLSNKIYHVPGSVISVSSVVNHLLF